MKLVTRSVHQAAEIVGRRLGRVGAVIIGFVMIAVGVGMAVTIVMLPVGIVTLLLGVLIVVGGIFARDERNEA
jgi:uncharacterized membrane protein YccC